ncbi:hypothetical protein BASA81_001064 [Batrachochytrium salamandrivorans]|nr:hypothetical protein BASA81_001064 [Batrachochytrium salamandrivorans]
MQTRSSKQRMVLRSGLVLKPLSSPTSRKSPRSKFSRSQLPRSILLKSVAFAVTPQKSMRQVSFAPIAPNKLLTFATPPTSVPTGFCTICQNYTCKLRTFSALMPSLT